MSGPAPVARLAGAVGVSVLALRVWLDLACRPALEAVRAPGPASISELLVLAAAAAALALGGWLVVGMSLELLGLLPGRFGALARGLSRRVTPAVLRRAVALSVGIGVGAAGLAPAAAATGATGAVSAVSGGGPVVTAAGEDWPDPGFHAPPSESPSDPPAQLPSESPTPPADPARPPTPTPTRPHTPHPTATLTPRPSDTPPTDAPSPRPTPSSRPTPRPTDTPPSTASTSPSTSSPGLASTASPSPPSDSAEARSPSTAPDPGWTPRRPVQRPVVDTALIGGQAGRDLGEHTSTRRAEVVVLRGDTLWSIAARDLGVGASDAEIAAAWPEWWDANRHVIGDDPDLVLPGQILHHPALSEVER